MRAEALIAPPGAGAVFSVIGNALAALLFGLLLFGYLLAVELHLMSDHLQPHPARLAPLIVDDARVVEMRRRAKRWVAARRGEQPAELTLENDDLDAFVAANSDIEDYRRHLRLRLQNDTVIVAVSVPMHDRGFPGRYLNAEISAQLQIDDDGPHLTIERVNVGEAALTPRLLGFVRGVASLLPIAHRLIHVRRLANVEQLWIEDGRLHLRLHK